jgi:hypothetical protein
LSPDTGHSERAASAISSTDSAITSLRHPGFGSGHPNRPILALVALMLSEYLFHRLNHVDSHDASETVVTLAIVGNKAIAGLTAGLTAGAERT